MSANVAEELQQLTTKGLEDFQIEVSSAHIKLDGAVVESTVRILNDYANQLDNAVDDLRNSKDTLINEWESATKNAFEEIFPQLIQKFDGVPATIRSIATWADDHAYNQDYNDQTHAAAMLGR